MFPFDEINFLTKFTCAFTQGTVNSQSKQFQGRTETWSCGQEKSSFDLPRNHWSCEGREHPCYLWWVERSIWLLVQIRFTRDFPGGMVQTQRSSPATDWWSKWVFSFIHTSCVGIRKCFACSFVLSKISENWWLLRGGWIIPCREHRGLVKGGQMMSRARERDPRAAAITPFTYRCSGAKTTKVAEESESAATAASASALAGVAGAVQHEHHWTAEHQHEYGGRGAAHSRESDLGEQLDEQLHGEPGVVTRGDLTQPRGQPLPVNPADCGPGGRHISRSDDQLISTLCDWWVRVAFCSVRCAEMWVVATIWNKQENVCLRHQKGPFFSPPLISRFCGRTTWHVYNLGSACVGVLWKFFLLQLVCTYPRRVTVDRYWTRGNSLICRISSAQRPSAKCCERRSSPVSTAQTTSGLCSTPSRMVPAKLW